MQLMEQYIFLMVLGFRWAGEGASGQIGLAGFGSVGEEDFLISEWNLM